MKIYIATWMEGKNFGDDYIAEAFIRYLQDHYPNIEVINCNLIGDGCDIKPLDIFIVAGGGMYGPSDTGWLAYDLYDSWINLSCELVLANIGIETYDPKSSKQLLSLVKKSAIFSLRDKKSFDIVSSVCGVGKVLYSSDSTYLSPLYMNRKPVNNYVGVNLCGAEAENYSNPYNINGIVEMLKKIREIGYVFKSVVCQSGNRGDYQYCVQVDPSCQSNFDLVPYVVCEVFIGMHFHSVVLALQNNIPTIAINYSDKVKRIMEEYGLGSFCLEPNDPKLYNKIKKCLDLLSGSKARRKLLMDKMYLKNLGAKERLIPLKKKLHTLIDKLNR